MDMGVLFLVCDDSVDDSGIAGTLNGVLSRVITMKCSLHVSSAYDQAVI